ncbi:Ppx/GppA phosphatase family protein [Corynebacterium sp. CMW7794]|uniref:Ppx/GppA family phosphatase n=1 Tax=Corynebacterium phoceense TaxID=1686286 RepID=A0A540R5W7_9CORY|nr:MULTISPECIES: Ppx/GppA phosphatase family protein [Corynebacterium]KXB53685.1 Ppx/GppA phosphatase family protein [Corynebacterium sp. DNF00584]KXI19642.1 Ppx/GppA phosphatase family protein [Corynebacterium sp. CMW7794]MCQ9340039.1 Ppx/GppA family phosphatase [Corynebacterium phoceense]MCQ9345544.1 Ppx/GppA family phosphatase [Corynebacterium phoceense]OFL77272.1 exopolyphosphatase [Corynebacterium sp. HMSC077B05]
MTRVAAVDCGTNSIRLLISDVQPDGTIRDITRLMEIVRLGEGVDATGEFAPAALERTRAALEKYVKQMKFEKVERVRMVATSASRDASNREEFFSMTAELLGEIQPGARAEVISGDEEAKLSFTGAVADLGRDEAPYCVIDVGGGSTEFVVGTADGELLGSHSAQMGSVRLTERIMRSDPATETELEIARDYVAERMEDVLKIVPLDQARTFVGCAGTFTTMSALAQGLERYDSDAIHGSVLRFDALRVLIDQILIETSASLVLNPVIHPGRADVIGGGSMVVQGIIDAVEKVTEARSFVISEKDILDGIIAGLAAELADAPTS